MRIIAHNSICYEDALDAVICAQNGLELKQDFDVSFVVNDAGEVAVVEPSSLEKINLLGEDAEDYVVIREA